jgi:ABC-type transporter MlaC component
MWKAFLLVVMLLLAPTSSKALTTLDAQRCADQLLAAYNARTYPRTLLALPDIIQRAYGPPYRSMRPKEKETANAVAAELLRTSFTHPSGRYRYQNLIVTLVKPNKSGYSVSGEVYITTPDKTGVVSFTALLKGNRCLVYQVRVAGITALDLRLREMLENDPRTMHFFK